MTDALPSAVAEFAERLRSFIENGHGLEQQVRTLEDSVSGAGLTEVVRRGRVPYENFPIEASIEGERASDDVVQRDAAIRATMLTRNLLNAVPVLVEYVASIEPSLASEPRLFTPNWSEALRLDISAVGDCRVFEQIGTGSLSDIPWAGRGISPPIRELVDGLEKRLATLRMLKRGRAEPGGVPQFVHSIDTRSLHPTEAAALLHLGDRPYWGVDELPEAIDADILRRLDTEGFVEAQYVFMRDRGRGPTGVRIPPRSERHGWFSPIRNSNMAKSWPEILSTTQLDGQHHPCEVKVSERGWGEIARLRRLAEDAATGSRNTGLRQGLTWQEARQKAENLVKNTYRGKPPPKTELAKKVRCSRNTMLKAIKNSDYLKARYAEVKAAVQQSSVPLSERHLEKVAVDQHDELRRLVQQQADDQARDRRTSPRSARS